MCEKAADSDTRLLLPDDLWSRGLKPTAKPVLETALERIGEEINRHNYNVLHGYYAEICELALLSAEEEAELSRRILDDRDIDARNKLVEHNLRFVLWVISKYTLNEVEFSDLVQAGNIALIRAADKYDHRLGRFANYARWWIDESIRTTIEKTSLIRPSSHMRDLYVKILKTSREIAMKLGRVPDSEEIATRMDISKEIADKTLLSMRISIISLDDMAPMGGNSKGKDPPLIGSTISDEDSLDPEQHVQALQELEIAQRGVNTLLAGITAGLQLPQRHQEIFKMYYGFDGSGKRRMQKYIGKQLGITTQRVQQIIAWIWNKADSNGLDINRDQLLQQLARIDELKELV